MHSIYNKEREAALQASLWGTEDERFGDTDFFDGGGNSIVSTSSSDTEESVRERLRKKIRKIVAACYPWIHAGNEGIYRVKLPILKKKVYIDYEYAPVLCMYCSFCFAP